MPSGLIVATLAALLFALPNVFAPGVEGAAAQPGTGNDNPRFRAAFRQEDQVSVRGEESNPIRSSFSPALHPTGVYVSDYSGHRFFVFSPAGRLREVLGAEGSAGGRMRLPYGATTDETGFVYLNERGSDRLHVLDPAGRLAYVIAHHSTAEHVHVARRRGEEITLFLVGPTRCDAPIGCAGRRMRLRGETVIEDQAFGDIGASLPAIATWTGAPLPDGGFLLVNVTSNVVERYGPDLRKVGQIVLPVPERVELRQGRREGPPAYRPYGFTGPRIQRIAVAGERLLVQWTASPSNAPTYRFVVGVYTLAGEPLVQHAPTDWQLVSARGDRVTFSRFVPEGPGRVDISTFRLTLPR